MRGYVKGNLLRLAAFLLVFGLMAAASGKARFRESEQQSRILGAEEFLLDMMDAMRRGEAHDWPAELDARGLGEFRSVDWDTVYGGAYLAEWEGFPRATGLLITQECLCGAQRPEYETLEILGRGKEIFLYRLTTYWD